MLLVIILQTYTLPEEVYMYFFPIGLLCIGLAGIPKLFVNTWILHVYSQGYSYNECAAKTQMGVRILRVISMVLALGGITLLALALCG